MNVDPRTLARREVHALINGLVAPRPIAWVSSVAADGTRNLAPFSFFNAFSTSPPTIAIGPGSRQGVPKDTQANIRASGEFTISMVGRESAEKANLSSAEVPADVDEWTFAGVTPVASVDVTPERVAESPASFECRVHQVVDLGLAGTATNALIIARIVRIHVDDALLDGETLPIPIGSTSSAGREVTCGSRPVNDSNSRGRPQNSPRCLIHRCPNRRPVTSSAYRSSSQSRRRFRARGVLRDCPQRVCAARQVVGGALQMCRQ